MSDEHQRDAASAPGNMPEDRAAQVSRDDGFGGAAKRNVADDARSSSADTNGDRSQDDRGMGQQAPSLGASEHGGSPLSRSSQDSDDADTKHGASTSPTDAVRGAQKSSMLGGRQARGSSALGKAAGSKPLKDQNASGGNSPSNGDDQNAPMMGLGGTSEAGKDMKDQLDDSKGSGKSDRGKSSVGKKVAKTGAVAAGAGAVALPMLIGATVVKTVKLGINAASMLFKALMMWLKGLVASIGSAIMGGVAAVGAAVGSALGVAGSAVAIGTMVSTVVTTVLVTGAGFVYNSYQAQQTSMRDGGLLQCDPVTMHSAVAVQDYEIEGNKDENAQIIYSALAGNGMPDENIAGILGNWAAESSIDPTGVETIFDEPFQIGPRKQAAWDANWDIRTVNPVYAARYPAIDKMGVGLGQWTNGRNTLLMGYADAIGKPWHELHTQLGFMFTEDDPSRVAYMQRILDESLGTPEAATRSFMSEWEGLNDGSTGQRISEAERYMGLMSGWSVDQSIADTIFDAIGDAVDSATNGAASNARQAAAGCEGLEDDHRTVQLVDATCAEPGTGVIDYGYGAEIESVLHPNAMDGFLCGYGTFGPDSVSSSDELHLPNWHSYRPAGTGIGAGNRSDHTFAAALDISNTHQMTTKEGQEFGRDVAEWYMHHAEELNVTMVIYWEKVWLADQEVKPYEQWDQYPQAWCNPGSWSYIGSDFPVSIANPGDGSHNCSHRNHPHISFENDGVDPNL